MGPSNYNVLDTFAPVFWLFSCFLSYFCTLWQSSYFNDIGWLHTRLHAISLQGRVQTAVFHCGLDADSTLNPRPVPRQYLLDFRVHSVLNIDAAVIKEWSCQFLAESVPKIDRTAAEQICSMEMGLIHVNTPLMLSHPRLESTLKAWILANEFATIPRGVQ